MANSKNPYASPATHQDLSPFNPNLLQQPMTNPEDITYPTTAAKLLNTNQQQSANFIKPKEQADCSTGYEYGSRQTNADDWRNQGAQNPRVQNDRIQNQIGNGNLVAARADGNAAGPNGNHIR
nr:hypothetical protein [Tanacetum cinerariifolium]